ncbi:unnamed protein product, partial [Heterobilharzia americana]
GFSNTLLGLLSFILTVVTIRWMKVVKKPRTSASEPLLTNQPLSSYNSIHEVDSIDLTGTRSSINPIVQNQVLRARRRMIKYVMVGMFSVVISKLFMGIAFLLSSPGHNILVFVSKFFDWVLIDNYDILFLMFDSLLYVRESLFITLVK